MQPDFSKIPSMDKLLARLHDQSNKIDLIFIKQLLENLLSNIKNNPTRYHILKKNREEISEFIVSKIESEISEYINPTFKHVINGTGVILHT